MGDVAVLEMVRGLWEYHWWANRRLFEAATALGEEGAASEMGRQFSFPTVRRTLAHIYGADWVWLQRWQGTSRARLPGDEIQSLKELRERWDALEQEQWAFVGSLTPADLGRAVEYTQIDGRSFRAPLWQLLQHVANHATHHRSEVATILTTLSGSPPDTGLVTYQRIVSGQQQA